MIQASILFVLVAAASIGVQAGQFGGELGGHIEGKITYPECTESKFSGPLGRTSPTKYGLLMSIEEPNHAELLVLTVKFDDSHKDEPKDVVVLDMDSGVKVDTLTVLKKRTAWPYITLPLPIESICQDSAKQLLVIKFEDEIVDDSIVEMVFTLRSPLRSDNKAIYREGNLIKGNFANQQAHLAIPCFDDDKYETVVTAELVSKANLSLTSETCQIEAQTLVLEHNMVQFSKMTKLSQFSFTLTPAK